MTDCLWWWWWWYYGYKTKMIQIHRYNIHITYIFTGFPKKIYADFLKISYLLSDDNYIWYMFMYTNNIFTYIYFILHISDISFMITYKTTINLCSSAQKLVFKKSDTSINSHLKLLKNRFIFKRFWRSYFWNINE